MAGAIRALKKGHGYIAGDDGRNYYLHWSAMRPTAKDFRQLALRERVNFEVVANAKKESTPRAIDVFVIQIEQESTYESSNRRDGSDRPAGPTSGTAAGGTNPGT